MAGTEGDLELFKKAVASVLHDDGFKIATEKAGQALLVADRLSRWMVNNKNDAGRFACSLVDDVRKCCTSPRPLICHTLKERIWEKYYQLCSSEQFRDSWILFILESIGLKASPTFYQHVTKFILEEILKVQFPVVSSLEHNPETAAVAMLDFQESNALRYCGGYLLRSLKAKIMKSSHPLKESILLCLADLLEAAGDGENDLEADPSDSKKWTKAVDRGGLIMIDDTFFNFMVAVELEIRKFFNQQNVALSINDSHKKRAVEGVYSNEDVMFYWAMVSINWSPPESEELKKRIIEHYITVRGFSFASGFMEQFKQTWQKSTQKKKGLRKTLDSTATCN